MKIFKFGIFFLLISMVSCSSDSDATVDNPTNPQPEAQYFTYKVDGHDVQFTVMSAARTENFVLISGSAADGTTINLNFNTYGNVGEGMIYTPSSGGGSSAFKHLYAYDKKNHFNFSLTSVQNGQVKGSFSGKMYQDEYDLTSASSTIEGAFLLTYTTITAENPGMGLDAKIGNTDWHWTLGSQGGGFGSPDRISFESDDKYSFTFAFNAANVAAGTYTFNSASTINRMAFSSYLGTEDSYKDYTTAGTVTITSVTSETINFRTYKTIEGTFSFTATHPDTGETLTITNGHFKGKYELPI